ESTVAAHRTVAFRCLRSPFNARLNPRPSSTLEHSCDTRENVALVNRRLGPNNCGNCFNQQTHRHCLDVSAGKLSLARRHVVRHHSRSLVRSTDLGRLPFQLRCERSFLERKSIRRCVRRPLLFGLCIHACVACVLSARLNQADESVDLARSILEPVCRPDSMYRPPARLEHLLAQPVAVTRGLRRMVRNSIALDPAHETPWNCIVENTEIDAIACRSDLRHYLVATVREFFQYSGFEGRIGICGQAC